MQILSAPASEKSISLILGDLLYSTQAMDAKKGNVSAASFHFRHQIFRLLCVQPAHGVIQGKIALVEIRVER